MKKNIVFATCREQPALQPGDQLLADCLSRLGYRVIPAPWNGPQQAFRDADAVIVRSTWDYQKAPGDFAAWLDRFGDGARVINAPSLMRWNMSKKYLLELERRGAPMAPLRAVAPDAESIEAAMVEMNLAEAVVKPEFGATGSGLSLVRRDDLTGLAKAAEKMATPGLVQALIPEIRTAGETSLIFIAGAFSHAVVKRPKAGEILCQSDHGGSVELTSPPDWAVREAERILTMAPTPPFYARVDVVLVDGGLQLMEVELIEPELFFTYAPEAASHFAAALSERL